MINYYISGARCRQFLVLSPARRLSVAKVAVIAVPTHNIRGGDGPVLVLVLSPVETLRQLRQGGPGGGYRQHLPSHAPELRECRGNCITYIYIYMYDTTVTILIRERCY